MTALFPVAGRLSTGYHRGQVEAFLARARSDYEREGDTAGEDPFPPHTGEGQGPADGASTNGDTGSSTPVNEHAVRAVAFDLVRSGYATVAVDAALDRLEAALVQRRRDSYIASYGQQAWMDKVADLATTLYPRLVRPAGERFAPPPSGKGYDRDAVDAVMDRLVAYFDADADLSAAELRAVTFPSARAADSYAEGVVDAYLDRAVEVLLAVE